MRRSATIALLCLFVAAPLSAQGEWAAVKALPAGTPVRVNGTADWLEATNDVEIVLRGAGVMPRKQVNRVEVVGIKGNRLKRAAVGVVIGAVAGAALMTANGANEFGAFWGSSIYGGLGGVTGAFTGHSSTHHVIYRR